MPASRVDTDARRQLAELLHALGRFCTDAALAVERDNLQEIATTLTEGAAAPADGGRHYVLLASHLATATARGSILAGQIAGSRVLLEALERDDALTEARARVATPHRYYGDPQTMPRGPYADPRAELAARRTAGLARPLSAVPPSDDVLSTHALRSH